MTDTVAAEGSGLWPEGSELLTLRRVSRRTAGPTELALPLWLELTGTEYDWRVESRRPVGGEALVSNASLTMGGGAREAWPAGSSDAMQSSGAGGSAVGTAAVGTGSGSASAREVRLQVLLSPPSDPATAGDFWSGAAGRLITGAFGAGALTTGALTAGGREELGVGTGPDLGVTLALHGAQVGWRGEWGVVLAARERWDAAASALAEFRHYAAELAEIEQALVGEWDRQRAGETAVFAFERQSGERLREVDAGAGRLLELRRRLVQVVPLVQRPAQFPPTLAGQLAERLRERTRMAERVEHVQEQLDQLDRVHDVCGQRLADLQASRRGQMLELIIIAILGFQSLLWLVELLLSSGSE